MALATRIGNIDYQKLSIHSNVADELRNLSNELSSDGQRKVTMSETLLMLIRHYRQSCENSDDIFATIDSR
jgi:hypothetical protein